jgi:alpha-L-arabinofuranosidase
MKLNTLVFFALFVLFTSSLSLLQAQTPSASGTNSLTIDVNKPGITVSPLLYGILIEEINHSGDGGLYAELIRNRSFEDSDEPDYWTLDFDTSSNGEMSIDTSNPMSKENPRSLRLDISAESQGRVGAVNNGYWGIPLVKDEQYDLSVALRGGNGFFGPVFVNLESNDGKTVYAQARIDNITSDWKTYKLSLTSNATDPQARLIISASQPGSLWMDMASLYPRKTFKDRPNGMRPDLAQMLVNLRPSFVRFPGGCWVEGDTMEHAMRWKLTIGDLDQRLNQQNLWQYYSTNGLGFYEYLQLCEDLGAEPLFAVNCGMSQKDNVPMDAMGPWVQDALDAIEYANGPADSKFGSLRAKAGHPAPFNLKYVEIGNENGGTAYNERYTLFYDAIKAKYPQINLIANEWDGKPTSRPVEILDEHNYTFPLYFFRASNKYDSYDRKGPKILVGEYAVTSECGQGNLRAAVAEAAFMTGLERNSDAVVMASYAPLFVNVNDRGWNPDLINFDSSRVYGTPSYYVQKMFSENRGDVDLPVKLESPPQSVEPKHGAIAFSTWLTQTEFKDIKVTKGDKTLFASNFSKPSLTGWKVIGGHWIVKDGALQQTAIEPNCLITTGDPSWSDYTITLKARKISGEEGFLLMFNYLGENNRMMFNIGGFGNKGNYLTMQTMDGYYTLAKQIPYKAEGDRWYDARIELKGETIRCFLDGKLLFDINKLPTLTPLYAVAGLNKTGDEVILKVVNASFHDQETDIHLAGVKEVQPSATAIILTSEDPLDENTFERPTKVSPVTLQVKNAGKDFRYKFPADSVTIMRMKIKQ